MTSRGTLKSSRHRVSGLNRSCFSFLPSRISKRKTNAEKLVDRVAWRFETRVGRLDFEVHKANYRYELSEKDDSKTPE